MIANKLDHVKIGGVVTAFFDRYYRSKVCGPGLVEATMLPGLKEFTYVCTLTDRHISVLLTTSVTDMFVVSAKVTIMVTGGSPLPIGDTITYQPVCIGARNDDQAMAEQAVRDMLDRVNHFINRYTTLMSMNTVIGQPAKAATMPKLCPDEPVVPKVEIFKEFAEKHPDKMRVDGDDITLINPDFK